MRIPGQILTIGKHMGYGMSPEFIRIALVGVCVCGHIRAPKS